MTVFPTVDAGVSECPKQDERGVLEFKFFQFSILKQTTATSERDILLRVLPYVRSCQCPVTVKVGHGGTGRRE